MFLSSPILVLLAGIVHAQFPAAPDDLEVITSGLDPDVKLSYKEVRTDKLASYTVLTLHPGAWSAL